MEDKALANYDALKNIASGCGINLFGVADITNVKNYIRVEPKEVLDSLNFGIALGVRLSGKVLETLVDGPSKLYSFHYKRVNILLDEASLKITSFIQERGYDALPIPASQIIDWKNNLGHISHQMVAQKAGLGWMGRNNLMVNPLYGAHVRYASVLTDMPLKADVPNDVNCGSCHACISACPVEAIGESREDFDIDACYGLLKDYSKRPDVGQFICGLCVKACSGAKA